MKRILILGIVLFITICSNTGSQLLAQTTNTDASLIVAPPSIAIVGVEYKFQIPIDAGAKVTFKLTRAPIGMTIDSLTGIVKWTPTLKGTYSAEVKITASSLKISSYSWTIQVVRFIGTIKGVVKNENSELLKNILISVYKKVSTTAITTYLTQLSASTDSVGAYSIAIADSGEFYIQANPGPAPMLMSPIYTNGYYVPVWYIDSPTMAGATAVLVKNATPMIANFILKKYQPPVPVLITGTVSGTDDKPITGATVVASMTLSPISTSSAAVSLSFQDPGFGLFCDVGGKERTDSLGHYKLSVVSGNSYIVAAYKEGYILQYYNGKSNVLEADKIALKHDTSGINFKLNAVPVAKAKVSGVVVDSTKAVVGACVILYPLFPQSAALIPVPVARTINTDSLGIFTFTAVANGSYKLQVVPSSKYMPAYFKANNCGVNEAKNADSIIVKNDQSVSGLVVCVKKIVANGGGKISGKVINSNGSGVCGVVVSAQSQNSYSYGITENDGSYEIIDLDPGTYTASTDKIGYTSIITTAPVIDYVLGLFNSEANFTLTEQTTTSVETTTSTLPGSFALYGNYPNPFNPSTQISFTLPSDGIASLRIFNILGQVVATLVDGYMTAGKHSLLFEPGNVLSSGVYVYELKYKDRVAVNKMILMK